VLFRSQIPFQTFVNDNPPTNKSITAFHRVLKNNFSKPPCKEAINFSSSLNSVSDELSTQSLQEICHSKPPISQKSKKSNINMSCESVSEDRTLLAIPKSLSKSPLRNRLSIFKDGKIRQLIKGACLLNSLDEKSPLKGLTQGKNKPLLKF